MWTVAIDKNNIRTATKFETREEAVAFAEKHLGIVIYEKSQVTCNFYTMWVGGKHRGFICKT